MDLSFLPVTLSKRYATDTTRFNPCSYGSFVLTDLYFSQINGYMYLFQSLFLWIFRSYLKGTIAMVEALGMFQSLFLWIFRSYRDY